MGKLEIKLSLFNILREMQIKTTTTYPLERLKKKKKTTLKFWWECKVLEPLWKINSIFCKFNISILYNPRNSILDIYLMEVCSYVHQKLFATLFIIAKKLETTQYPSTVE